MKPAPFATLPVVLLLAVAARAQLGNGSFETGDLAGWSSFDVTEPAIPLQVVPAGTPGAFGTTTQPTDGHYSLLTGFEGDGGGYIQLSLGTELEVSSSAPVLLMDYVARWDLQKAASWTNDRTFGLMLWDSGGWAGGYELLRAPGGTVNLDADRVTVAVDLRSFVGDPLQLDLRWEVPGDHTGPASFELDNLRFAGRKVSALQRARLAIALDFAQPGDDRLALDVVVPVPLDFDPEGEPLVVAVGDVLREFTLDASGKAQVGADKARVLPVSGAPGQRRLVLSCRDDDLAADLVGLGLSNDDTGSPGKTLALPFEVLLGGETTARELTGLYKATAGMSGKALARATSEVWHTSLSVAENLELADESTLHLTTAMIAPPGFAPEGKHVRVDVGGWSKTFTLDADGKEDNTAGTDGVDRIHVSPDKSDPGRQIIKLTGSHGNFWDVSDALDLYESPPPGGYEIQVPVTVTLDGRSLRSIVTVTLTGQAYKWAKVHS